MSNREKQRLKRKEKQRQLHKARNQSSWETIRSEPEQCILIGGPESGLTELIMVFAQRGGLRAVLAFEIDLWCTGLRDIAARADLGDTDVSDFLLGQRDLPRRTCSADEARRLIAGGIRFATQNKFRLPDNWQRYATIAGAGRWQDADLSGFGKDGKLLYVGPLDRLGDSYLGNPDDLFKRDDFDFIAESGGKTLSSNDLKAMQERAKDLGEVIEAHATPLIEEARQRAAAQGGELSELFRPTALHLFAQMMLALGDMGEKWDPQLMSDTIRSTMGKFLEDYQDTPQRKAAERAVKQIGESLVADEKGVQAWLDAAGNAMDDPRLAGPADHRATTGAGIVREP